jgi:hypothetical protein
MFDRGEKVERMAFDYVSSEMAKAYSSTASPRVEHLRGRRPFNE